MFSGIIEAFATVVAIEKDKENVNMTLTCPFVSELKIDQSVAHNGVCLTVVEIEGDNYVVTAMKETLDRSNLGLLKVGDKVNVERSMMINGRLDGHIVQGHVDTTATCISMEDAQGSTYFTFRHESSKEMVSRGYFTVDKGSEVILLLIREALLLTEFLSQYATPRKTHSKWQLFHTRWSTRTSVT